MAVASIETIAYDKLVRPSTFLTELATNSSANSISWVFYSGNDDFIIAHRGTEGAFISIPSFFSALIVVSRLATIQNTTFGGIQGFTRKPSTAWFDDDGAFAGIVHQERNLTYLLFEKAGHLVAQWQPARVSGGSLSGAEIQL